jgi:cation diffusion facilitator family transporter
MSKITSARVVRTSFLVDILDILLNLTVALFSGSVVMLVQSLQGTADLFTSGLLVIGVKRSRRIKDKRHHFGYGREIYFWTLMAGVAMITVTTTLSVAYGWRQLTHPMPITHIGWALLVLAIGFATNLYALLLSYRRLQNDTHTTSLPEMFLGSVLVETKAAFVLDLMGVMSAIFGFFSLVLYTVTGEVAFDGLGAIFIGLITALLALLLIVDVKDLLIGRSAPANLEEQIKNTALAIKGVDGVLDLRTMYLGSERLLVNLELDIANNLKTEQIEQLIDIIKADIKAKVPTVHHIQVELETPRVKNPNDK